MWDFIQDEIFGMKWLNRLIDSLLNACGLDTESKLGGSLQFFIYDMIKIMVLLGVTFSLLISSPMVDFGSLILLMSIFGCIPIAEALVAKGAKLGVVLAFMMGVITLSLENAEADGKPHPVTDQVIQK